MEGLPRVRGHGVRHAMGERWTGPPYRGAEAVGIRRERPSHYPLKAMFGAWPRKTRHFGIGFGPWRRKPSGLVSVFAPQKPSYCTPMECLLW